IVGDAARQPPNGFHLLRVTKLLFELPPLCDVLNGTDHPDGASVRIAFDVRLAVHPPDLTCAGDDTMFDVVRPSVLNGRKTGGTHHRKIVGMDDVEEGL